MFKVEDLVVFEDWVNLSGTTEVKHGDLMRITLLNRHFDSIKLFNLITEKYFDTIWPYDDTKTISPDFVRHASILEIAKFRVKNV